ncbi:MAG: hypothetical protein HY901_19705, partial [Deltaproteobacteria bacterium]|nr:hypothetical protein [Deltaproteobacteria bacterium]
MVCSLGAHGILALFFLLTGFFSIFSKRQPLPVQSVNPVVFRAVPSSEWSQNREIGPRPNAKVPPSDPNSPQLQAKKEEEKKKEPEPIPKGKVVDVAPGNGLKPDDDAEFLAGTNNRVEKQTRSRDATPNYKNAMPRPSSPLEPSDG